jgi:flagellar M-ring protein FliF
MTKGNQTVGASQPLEKLKVFWAGLGSRQRIYLGAGLAITLAAMIIFIEMISMPNYKLLMSGLESADTQAISAQLAAKKIPYLVSPDGTSISVPADQVDAARLEVASHDSPHSGRIGFEIFDKVSWGQTEFDEKVNYQRALEGELERTIQTISNVKSARVHLVMASDSVFMDRARGAKASVTLRLRRGSLSRDELSSIARLVAGAVDELKPSDVVILDADSDQSLETGNSSNGASDNAEADLTKRLVATLAPIVGADAIHATVNIEYETGSSEESQDKYDPAVSAPLNMQHSEEVSGPGSGIGGVPGTSSNVAKAKAGAATVTTKEPGQSSKTDSATHTIEPAGRIRRLTAAVVVDDVTDRKQQNGKWVEVHRKRQPEDMQLITQLAQAAIGFDSARGDVVSVQNLTFDHPAVEDPAPLAFADKARNGLNDYSTAVRYAVLLILFMMVYLLMIRPIQRRALAIPLKVATQPSMAEVEPRSSELPNNSAIFAQRALLLKQQLSEFVRTEPESSATAVRAWLQEDTP